MNAQRTSSVTPSVSSPLVQRLSCAFAQYGRSALLWLAAALLIALVPLASQAGLKPAALGGNGAVLALAAQLRAARIKAASGSNSMQTPQRTPSGRTLLPRQLMRSGAIRRDLAAASTVVPISSAVQTYDVSNPPPAFRPLIGYGSIAALNNNSSNPPVYIASLAPTNLYPVWSADETFLVFSSNRDAFGALSADGRYHLWAISVNGGQAFQITTSTGPVGGGEFFPALSSNNNKLAFTSDAQSAGTQNLYAIGFSSAALTAGAAPVNVSDVTAVSSLTLRAATETASAAQTGFTNVQHPTFGTSDGQLIVFSALSVTGTNTGHAHLYFLYQSSGGFSNSNQTSYPGKLTDGPADDTDATFSPDGQFIAFSSTATTIGNNPSNAFGPTPPGNVQDPNQSQSLTAGPVATRSIFLISGGGSANGIPFGTTPASKGIPTGRVTVAGTDDYGPAWSNFANQNQYTNPALGIAYLAFARATAPTANHDIYYLRVGQGISSPSTETLFPEAGGNAAIHLNTDDAANAYDDIYPSWSPFLSVFSLTYMSNRTVTYNDPTNSQPTETAVSVGHGGTVTSAADATANYGVGTGYEGLLVSQLLNLDPPTLLRFSSNEVVHVQSAGTDPVRGTPNKLAVSGGQNVTLTVRLSDRESGIDDTGGPNGGPRVYVQIKDPDGKYQDAQSQEHKVFAKDGAYPGQPNQPLNDVTSDSINFGISNNTNLGYGNVPPTVGYPGIPGNKYLYPSYMNGVGNVGNIFVGVVAPRGAHGGHYFAPDTNDPSSTYIFVGKGAAGTTNAGSVTNPGPPIVTFPVPGTDPIQFIPQGPEYECQLVNPQFLAGGTGDTQIDDPTVTVTSPGGTIGDYVSPFWLAGVDDQGAYSGGVYTSNTAANTLPRLLNNQVVVNGIATPNGVIQTDRPTADFTDGNGTVHPAEWLQLARVPDSLQDHNGGVLYTVTWKTPTSGSDFYVDVIAYDKAAFPNIPGSGASGQKTNWRIYDNVGGFSTNQSVGGNDILVVSDYALGQKFAATTFGGRNLNLNLVPKIFGTESYLTDVDVNTLPDSVYAGIPTSPTSYQFNPAVQVFGDFSPGTTFFNGYLLGALNGLGVGSYIDGTIDDNTLSADGNPNVQSQRYSIWRILSRGPVPQTLLTSYQPKKTSQPAIVDPAVTAFANVPAATVLDASQCIIWLSPYTGDVLADPGTIDDPGNVGQTGVAVPRPSTTSSLTTFVQGSGRLCVTGQDVGSTLTLGGTVNNAPSATAGSPNFLPDVLNATLTANSSGINVLAATNNRITGNPFYDGTSAGRYLSSGGPIQGPYFSTFPNYPYQDNLVLGDADFSDSGLSQVPALRLPGGASIQGQPDAIAATNGAIIAATYGAGGPGALVFHDDPYNAAGTGLLPNGGTGSRVVYAAFGLEGLSQDYYASASPNPSSNPAYDEIIPHVVPRNPRSEILHNIVSYLRTGRVSGTITQTAGTGQGGGLGIAGVTVYLRPTNGAPPSRAAFSALTVSGGSFTISGVEPGTYTLVALKPGFQRATSNSNVFFTVEGDVTKTGATLTMTPLPPANIAGVVQDTSKAPINGATVVFTSQDHSITRSITTVNGSVTSNAADNYFLQGVPVTTYTATATGPLNSQGLQEYTPAIAPDAPNAAGVTTSPNTTTDGVNFTLTASPASISGIIIDSVTSAPIPGATVKLIAADGTTVLATVTAGTDGTYSFTGIVATTALANFTVSAVAPGYAPNSVVQALQAGSVYTGINIPLTAIPSGNVTGTVTDVRTGLPLAGATVTFTLTGGLTQTATTAADGTYTLTAIPIGTYSGVATGPATGQAYVPSSAQTVPVVNAQTTTANFALVPVLSAITGTVTDASTNLPLAGVSISVADTSGNPITTTPATITTDASGNYSATLAPGTYTVSAAKTNYDPQTAAAQPFALGATVAVPFKLVSSIGTVGGLVTDPDGTTPVANATVTVTQSAATAATYATSGTATTGPDGAAINYSGSLPKGTYTFVVTKGGRQSATVNVTIKGGQFNRVDFTTATNGSLPALYTFPAGIQLISTPYDYSSLGFDGLFGTLNTAPTGTTPNGNRSHVAVWNPLVGAYALDPNAPADTLRLGVGYWVYLKAAVPVLAPGTAPTTPYVSVALGQGWNQIGVPDAVKDSTGQYVGVAVSRLLFADGKGSTITYTQASSSQYNVINPSVPLYQYAGTAGYQSVGATGTLKPWTGYWIYVNVPATLEIPTN